MKVTWLAVASPGTPHCGQTGSPASTPAKTIQPTASSIDRLLEIDGFVDDASDLVGGLVGGAIRIGKQFGQGYLNASPHPGWGNEHTRRRSGAATVQSPTRLRTPTRDPQIQIQKGRPGQSQLQPDACRAVHGVMQLEHRSPVVAPTVRCRPSSATPHVAAQWDRAAWP